MFKLGDRVIYTATYHIASKKCKNKKGTIRRVGTIPRARPQEQTFQVEFDFDGWVRTMYLANLKPANETPDWEL
jgi:hypothetical protein